jgi:hypothetical protein
LENVCYEVSAGGKFCSVVFDYIPDIDLGSLSVSWQRSFRDDDKIRRSEGQDTVALSAFMLTSLPTTIARKALVKEMWESGAHVMVRLWFDCNHCAHHFQGTYRSQHYGRLRGDR